MKRLYLVLLTLLVFAATSCAFAVPRTLALPSGCTSWGKLPLTVAVDESAEAYRSDVNRSMKAWNDAMHVSAFTWAYVAQAEPDVIVALGPMHSPNERGYASAACARGRTLSTVVLEAGLDAGSITTYATHELGHALGLGHATNEQSIMHATIEADLLGQWDDEHAPKFYRILPGDARLAAALHAEHVASVTEGDAGVASGIGTSPSGPKDGGIIITKADADPWAAFGAGNWAFGVVLLLIMGLSLLKKVVPALFASDLGGAATAFLSSFLGALVTAGAGAAFTWSGVKAAFAVAVLAMGGYSVLWRKLAKPGLKWVADHLPWAWAAKVSKALA